MNKKTSVCKIALTCIVFSSALHISAFAASQNSLNQQRALYTQAKQAFAKKDNALANKLTNSLKNYSLYPYLKLKQLQRDIKTTSQSQIHRFIKTYADSPVAKKAQASYLQNLANTKQWRLFEKNYRRLPLTSAYYTCYNLQAKINTGNANKSLAEIAKLWNVGNSQPKSCNPVFAYWMKRGNPSSNLAFERSWKAINAKNYSVAKFTAKYVTKKSQQNSLELFWKIKKDVSLISSAKTLSKKTPHNNDISAYAIRKFAVKNTDAALNSWLRDRSRFKFTEKQLKYLNVYFANKYAKKTFYDPSSLGVLQKIDPNYQYDEISEWKTRLALISQNWKLVISLIGKMPKGLRTDNRWVYWLETAKQRANPKQYQAQFKAILQERDFYSYMAASLTNQPFKLNHSKTAIASNIKKSLLKQPSVQRMSELYKTGDTGKAYQEWRLLRSSLNDKQTLAMGYIANSWGWYIQGIRIAAKLKTWDELDIRFPRAKNKLFAKLGKERGIGSTWPVAIARQESAYNQYAQSPAGARGFMQLMPATAKSTAKKYNVPYKNKSDLFDPQTNISLGTAYLNQMMAKFNNQAHSTAAYNAGPHRAERWIKSRGTLPLDIWMETIPFNETRKYVQNVLTYSVIYDLLANRKAEMFSAKDLAQLTLKRR
ncbi:MAG: transglycosylase SLT domain-containing protein [Oceanospirillaceae bacterium]